MGPYWELTSVYRVAMNDPPNGLPRYRLLTGPDDASFCDRVSEMLRLGYVLVGSPSLTFDGEHIVAAQAIVWPATESE